ncbi:MAG: response regulator [Deltaproteobacteria bacterium]|nr:response regulator [Deltaproteobacteria bacterium]
MKEGFTILIADRNCHVRGFLKREIEADGYRVLLARNGHDIFRYLYGHEDIDLLILDLDQPDISVSGLLQKLENRMPPIPVVIHSFLSDYVQYPQMMDMNALVEKNGSSIDLIKKVITKILHSPAQNSSGPDVYDREDQ